eukprot:4157729-Alexandrium_andersonii.AAC.1
MWPTCNGTISCAAHWPPLGCWRRKAGQAKCFRERGLTVLCSTFQHVCEQRTDPTQPEQGRP